VESSADPNPNPRCEDQDNVVLVFTNIDGCPATSTCIYMYASESLGVSTCIHRLQSQRTLNVNHQSSNTFIDTMKSFITVDCLIDLHLNQKSSRVAHGYRSTREDKYATEDVWLPNVRGADSSLSFLVHCAVA
jgi:hypothetical protein